MNRMAWVGAAIMVVSEGATLARIEPFWSWNTPICWTGFILFADSVVWQARGNSWIRSSPFEFACLALASIPLWIVFEGFNLVIRNWYYTGLSENHALRLLGYAWAFATIWPAIFEGAELVAVARHAAPGHPGRPAHPARPAYPAPPARPVPPALPVVLGALMLDSPFVLPQAMRPYLAAPVWLGFIFLLDPLNAWLGEESLLADVRQHRFERLVDLAASGLLCGVLWEFWNFWARAKWHYSVPIMANVKRFEMPLPGYLGFPPFALECFAMYVFLRAVVVRVVMRPKAHAYPSRDHRESARRTDQLGRTIGL